MAIDIFVSHSSRDAELAKSLVELLRGALSLPANSIRCTSVSGYKLDVGADTDEQLRRETVEATALVGLLTDVSIDSAYVLFELGARWGTRKFLAPLLGAGRGAEILAGPLAGLNALTCTRDDLFQLIGNVATQLERTPERPEVYSHLIENVVGVSDELATHRGLSTHDEGRSTNDSTVNLTDLECDYLMEISRPRNEGFIYGGIDERKGREVAAYQEALERYHSLTLMTYSDGGHKLTPRGWSLADQLWQLKVLDVLAVNELKSEADVAKDIEMTDGDAEMKELSRLIADLETRELVAVVRTRGDWHARLTEAGATFRKHRPLSIT